MSDFFRRNQRSIDLFPQSQTGLRTPQLGAAAALIAHGTKTAEPAVIALPTGTGKTAVLQMTPFLWATGRVLVLTPSRMVRDQIAGGFASLQLLSELGVLRPNLDRPRIASISKRMNSVDAWERYREADVVVTTPMSTSPSIEGIANPPADLFDLVIIDEAHHSPAVSYSALLEAFPDARKAFFTATPFRRDKRIVPGKLIYNYSLKSAIDDGTYGRLQFLPCIPRDGENNDVAIAKLAETAFREDRKAGLDHRVMVRTDSKERARELTTLYERETALRLRLVHGGHSMKYVTAVMKQLATGDLDGVVCVDMFGEGVDFPKLKLAALHTPHKSLAVTLQFIGRFARTNAPGVGVARFIAVPQEIDAEVRDLYANGANWEELVANLADARVEEEESVRNGLASFQVERNVAIGDADLTIDALNPYFHAKVLRTDREPCLYNEPFVLPGCELIFHAVSDDLSVAVNVCQKKERPKWLGNPSLVDVKNLLSIVHYDRANHLLFIHSHNHAEDVYDSIAARLYPTGSDEVCMPLPHSVISRALRMLSQPCFYNLGMRNRQLGGQDESYRTVTGPKADRGVSRTDANTRSRGHVFGGSTGDSESMTLGVSTLSKLWSNKYGLIPRYVEWCRRLAAEINSATPVATGSNVDLLDTGQPTENIPAPPIAIVWHEHVYTYPHLLSVEGTGEERDLTGLELIIVAGSYSGVSVEFELIADDIPIAQFLYRPGSKELITQVDGEPGLTVRGLMDGPLLDLLRLRPPTIFLADFSTIVGRDWYRSCAASALDPSIIRTFREFGTTVDIEREISGARHGTISIHQFVESQFLSDGADVLIYDHRSGEVADLISLAEKDEAIICRLAHCKGAGGKKTKKPKAAATRVDDAYEVAGQVVKCLPFHNRPNELKEKLVRRLATGSALKRGSAERMERILDNARRKRFEFRICLVQPGLSASQLSDPVKCVLAAAAEYVIGNGGIAPTIWLSP